MHVIGLTGGIGMGKSTAAAAFRAARIPVFDADRCVHALQATGGAAVEAIAAAFPGTVHNGVIDRAALRAAAFTDLASLRRLEGIMHPLVRAAQARFLARARSRACRVAVLDIPLLLETGAERTVDRVVVVSAPAAIQQQRLQRRGRMRPEEIARVIAQQMPDAAKRRRADLVIRTGLSRHHARTQVRRLILELLA